MQTVLNILIISPRRIFIPFPSSTRKRKKETKATISYMHTCLDLSPSMCWDDRRENVTTTHGSRKHGKGNMIEAILKQWPMRRIENTNRFVISTRKLLHTVYAYEMSNKLEWLNERTFFWLIIFQRSFFTSQDTVCFYFFEKRCYWEKFHFLDVIDFMLLRDDFSNYTRANIFSNAIFFVAFRQERCPRQRHFWFFLFRCIIEGTFCLFTFVHDGKRYLGRVNSCSWGGGRSLITLIWIEKNERWIKEHE